MKRLLIIGSFLLLSGTAFSQKTVDLENDPGFMDRVYVGGGFGLGGGNGYFSFSVAPIAGYMITPKLSAGLGVSYTYVKYQSPPYSVSFNDNQYGLRPFIRYNVYQPIFLQAEYEYLNYTSNYAESGRSSVSRYLVGGGISQPLGNRGALNLVAMYDLNYSSGTSAYASPWVFRIYFSF